MRGGSENLPPYFMEFTNLEILPDSEFVGWLKRFDPNLRVRWNPASKRWCIDEKNKENGCYQNILIWQSDDNEYLPLNKDLVLRLELMRAKKNHMLIVGPQEYLRELQAKADWLERERIRGVRLDTKNKMIDEIGLWRKAWREAEYGRL